MAYSALSDGPVSLMPARVSAWSIYRIFATKDGESVFVGVTSDLHWQRFCQVFERADWATDARLTTNNQHIDEAAWLLPAVETMLQRFHQARYDHAVRSCRHSLCTDRPEELFDDPQLNQTDNKGLLHTTLPDGTRTKLLRLPMQIGAYDFGLRRDPPAIGADTDALLTELDYTADQITRLKQAGTIASQVRP